MALFQHRPAKVEEFPSIIGFLPPAQFECSREAALSCWQRWHQQGGLSVGIIEAVDGDLPPVIVGVGVTLWISDEAVAILHSGHDEACSVRLYRADSDVPWVLTQRQIASSHAQCSLNLWIVHFWPDPDPARPDFAAFFVQADASFRELHDGFGVRRLLQEIRAEQFPMMAAGGMRISRSATAAQPRVLVMLTREDARADPGSRMSFLFLKPPGQLGLKAAEQCMLTLALRQLTDADIAARMGCSREYIRKLWTKVYHALQANAGHKEGQTEQFKTRHRGREQRRLALEFFRAHLEELRPGRPLR